MSKSKSLRASLDQGSSVAEREGVPMYGSPEAYRVSDNMAKYVGPVPGGNGRHAPVRGSVTVQWPENTHGALVSGGVIESPSGFEVQGLVAERMAANMSVPQYAHAEWVRRGMPGKRDFADGTPRASGRIKAVHRFDNGLGAVYARPGPSGHDPVDTTPPTDYLRQPLGPPPGALDKYVGAGLWGGEWDHPVFRQGEYGSGYPRDHERTWFPTMGEEVAG